MTLQPVTLTGNLVHLEPLSEQHIPDLLDAARDERIWQYMFYGNLAERKPMESFIANAIRQLGLFFSVIKVPPVTT